MATKKQWPAAVAPTLRANNGTPFMGDQDYFSNRGGCTYSFNFELYATPPREVTDALCARRCRDWIVYQGE